MKRFQPRRDILRPAQRSLWTELSQVPPEFILYGGTAIALQLGHWQCVDFDFCRSLELDTSKSRETISFLSKARIVQNERSTLTAIVNREGNVTVSFFGVPRLPRLLPPLMSNDNGLKVARLLDLAGTKTSVVQAGPEVKDYFDLDTLITKAGVTMPMALTGAQSPYGKTFNPQITLMALSYIEDGNLRNLPEDTKIRLVTAARDVDLGNLASLSQRVREKAGERDLHLYSQFP